MSPNGPPHRHRHRSPSDRRSVVRLLCSDLVRVRWQEAGGERREEIAVVEDLSAGGATLFMGLPVACGTALTLCTRQGNVAAEVRHCQAMPNGHLVGVEVSGAWLIDAHAPHGYSPEHLLDVTRLDFTGGEPPE